jgi:D-alanyl-lipoteichoic acid acyltransferase DltB (MBOAT superfamily)
MDQGRYADSTRRLHSQVILSIAPITADSLTFATISLVLIGLAWSRWRGWFLYGLGVASLIVLISWLGALDLVALALFVVPPFLLIQRIWGKPELAATKPAAIVIAWEILVFIYLRKYEWAGGSTLLDQPVAIIGLSYMLFRIIHLVVEAPYLGHLSFGPVQYGAYIFAFWTLLSGPIQRYEAFAEGMKSVGRPAESEALHASHRLINGMIKAFLIAPVFLKLSDIEILAAPGANWLDFSIVLYAYPVYLYLNFSGYTDMVIAIARLCGVETLPENFNRPYLSRNLMDFWSRWHMSFGIWIRQYLFNPMSKYLLKRGGQSAQNALLAGSVIITFVIVGAWHGTTWNFILFGLLHGVGIVLTGAYDWMLKLTLGRQRRKVFLAYPVTHAISVVICFHFVSVTILLFPNRVSDLTNTLGGFFSAQGLL